MSFDPETTRIVRSWLDEGVTELPDRVLDAVLDQVPATHQRRVPWWPARRNEPMNAMLKFGLAAAVLALVAFIGVNTLGSSNVGGPGSDDPNPSPGATATPEATPEPTPVGPLPEGDHLLTDGDPTDGDDTLALTVTIPAPDWYGEPGEGILLKHDTADAPDGGGMIVFFGDLYVYGDPCQWSTTRPDEPATTVDELVTALTAQATREATEPVDITVGDHAGKSITLHVPEDAVFSECDQRTFGSWGVPGPDLTPFRYHQDPGQIDTLYILDVDGTLVTIDTAYYDGTQPEVLDEMEAIVDSASFD